MEEGYVKILLDQDDVFCSMISLIDDHCIREYFLLIRVKVCGKEVPSSYRNYTFSLSKQIDVVCSLIENLAVLSLRSYDWYITKSPWYPLDRRWDLRGADRAPKPWHCQLGEIPSNQTKTIIKSLYYWQKRYLFKQNSTLFSFKIYLNPI